MSTLLWFDDSGNILELPFDVVTSEKHGLDADVTADPVEAGADTTDNVRVKSSQLMLEVTLADSYREGGQIVVEPTRAAKNYSQLEGLLRSGTRLQVNLGSGATGFYSRTYQNMVLKSVSTTRTSKNKDTLDVALSFVQIRVANSEIVPVQVALEPKGQKRVDDGDKNTKPVEGDEAYKSTAYEILDAARN